MHRLRNKWPYTAVRWRGGGQIAGTLYDHPMYTPLKQLYLLHFLFLLLLFGFPCSSILLLIIGPGGGTPA